MKSLWRCYSSKGRRSAAAGAPKSGRGDRSAGARLIDSSGAVGSKNGAGWVIVLSGSGGRPGRALGDAAGFDSAGLDLLDLLVLDLTDS